MDTANTEKVGSDKVPEGTPNTENVVPKAVPEVGAGEGAAGQNAAPICNYVPFSSGAFYEALQNLGTTTTIDDCWSIFTGLSSETGSPLSYEEFERMVTRGC